MDKPIWDDDQGWSAQEKELEQQYKKFRVIDGGNRNADTEYTPGAEDVWPMPPWQLIEVFNARYAVVNEAGKALVFERVVDPVFKRNALSRMTFSDFKKLYQNRRVEIKMPGDGTRSQGAAEYWLNHKDRRQYISGVVFDPTGEAAADYWNLWSGFAAEPKPGDWSLLRNHIFEVICNRNEKHFEYLLNWIAWMFQHPERQGEVAVVVRGLKGVGKGILFQYLRKAWGQHGVYISNARHLVGNFNAHLRDCVFLFADEAFFAGDRQHESVLKGIVTDPVLTIEAKRIDVVNAPNMLHIGMASNSSWVVPASHDERRYFVLDASGHRRGQKAYFSAIGEQMDGDGLAAMIHDMLHRDLAGYDVGNIPPTAALAEQKKHSLDTVDRWWMTCLERGYVWRSRYGLREFAEWNPFYSTDLLHQSYLQWCADNRVSRPMSRIELGQRLAAMYQAKRPNGEEIIGEVESPAPGALERNLLMKKSRPHGYQVETLSEARAKFADARGVSGEWDDASMTKSVAAAAD